MYKNIGKKLMILAEILGWFWLLLGAAAAIVSVFMAQSIAEWLGLGSGIVVTVLAAAACLAAGFLMYIVTWPLYGLGQLIQDVHILQRRQSRPEPKADMPSSEPPRFAAPPLRRYQESPQHPQTVQRVQTVQQPSAMQRPRTVQQPAVPQQPRTMQQPAVPQRPRTVQQPAVPQRPRTVQQPAIPQQPQAAPQKTGTAPEGTMSLQEALRASGIGGSNSSDTTKQA